MMVTECMMTQVRDETDGPPSFPPGFYTLKSFNLQRVQGGSLVSTLGNEPVETKMDGEEGTTGVMNLRKSLRRRPWVNYCQHDSSSGEEESGSELSDQERFMTFDCSFAQQDSPLIQSLPKGVIRGCVECENCQKVIARWRPEGSCRPILDEAPVFYPSEEEFKDTLQYIASVRSRAEPYGICRIVPPRGWKPPCPLKEKQFWEGSTFTTRIQSVDKLQNRHSSKNDSGNHGMMKRKRRRLKIRSASRENNVNISDINDTGSCSQMFGFAQGPNFSLESFQKYAEFFKEQYFCNVSNSNLTEKWEPSIESIEGEYWRIVEHPTEEIEVLYGADLETAVFGSGFSKAPSCTPNSDLVECYAKSGWNLNNVPRLPGSVLAFESGDISGVLVPWLYVGMCFSSFCWHVEDHHLYSVNYLHWGAPKIWYGIPGREALNFETVMKKHLADLFEEQPNLLHKLVTQFSPSILKSESVPVYRCIQHPGEFVITFPRAYHSGFNCGFNCAEAVNIAPVDWLPHGQHAVELYREQMRKITISHDKLLLGTARETVKALWNILFLKENTSENLIWKDTSGPDGVLAKSLKARVELERVRRDHLSSSQFKKMDSAFDADCERECIVCHYDLHLSATSCPCSPDKFTCLLHAKHLCLCDWKTRFFLIRYEISELNILIDAVGGKLSAVHKWGVQDLRLSLSAYVSKEKISDSRSSNQCCSDVSKGIDKDGRCREFPVSFKDTTSMRDAKSSVQQSSSRAISKASSREMAVDSASGITNPNSPCQQRKSMAPSEIKESGKPDTSSLKIRHDQNLQKINLCSSSDARSFEEFISTKWSQNTGTTGYYNSCSPSEAEVNLQSKVISVMSSVATNLPAEDALLLKVNNKQEQIMPPEFGKGKPGTGEAVGAVNTSDKERICISQKKQVPVPPRACTTVILQQRAEKRDSEHNVYCVTQQPVLQLKEKGEGKTSGKCSSNIQTESPIVLVAQGASPKHTIDSSTARRTLSFSETKEVSECSTKTFGNDQKQHCYGISISSDVNEAGKVDDFDPSDKQMDAAELAATCSSFPLSNFDRQNHMQKGPRLAKVVRRISCNVELLECGVVLSGKLWSTCKAIFPKGYKSRVRYWNIIDPSQMCYYVSEILDAGLIGPLFMVKLEQRPSEVFFHVCVTKCWDMVRERVNNEIRRMHNLGRVNLPSIQPPGSIDGYEMFGLTSQTIIQAIEAIDQGRVCSEYWRSRPKVPNSSDSGDQRQALSFVGSKGLLQSLLSGSESKLAALLKKASSEELHALCTVLSIDQPEAMHELVGLIKEENRSRLGFKL